MLMHIELIVDNMFTCQCCFAAMCTKNAAHDLSIYMLCRTPPHTHFNITTLMLIKIDQRHCKSRYTVFALFYKFIVCAYCSYRASYRFSVNRYSIIRCVSISATLDCWGVVSLLEVSPTHVRFPTFFTLLWVATEL